MSDRDEFMRWTSPFNLIYNKLRNALRAMQLSHFILVKDLTKYLIYNVIFHPIIPVVPSFL